ncbi:glutathione S-transferase family protein [Amorphus sp. 3PC139-8]|uniref:glutathione S-transferase family protein n=1 Tax=Amorphus sp. 3PC139-8 TaxID=2735676 RepID=UPI00345CB98F
MVTLFYSPGTCALATHIALEEAGADYTLRRVDFANTEQRSPDYLAINPKGRVPSLVTEDAVLTETPALLAWVAQTHPEAELAPLDDPSAFARAQSFNSYLCSTVHVAHAHGRRAIRWTDDPAAIEALQAKVPETMAACYALIEESFLQGPWVMGERYSICDPYLYTISSWLGDDNVDIADYPKVADHFRRMGERPAVQRALAGQQG